MYGGMWKDGWIPLSPVGVDVDVVWGLAEVAVGEEASRKHPVGEQRDAPLQAQINHTVFRATIEKRVLDLVRSNVSPSVEHLP